MFAALNDLIEIFSKNPDHRKYAQFAEMREKGLRKKSLAVLREFVEEMKKQPFDQRREFVLLFCETALKWGGDSYLLKPQPLLKFIVRPTLKEWIEKDPESPLACRWSGTYFEGDWKQKVEFFRKATTLDPKDDYSRSQLINCLLDGPEYSIHHLNESIYLGNPKEDLDSLDLAKKEAQLICDSGDGKKWLEEIEILRVMISDWIEYLATEKEISFPQFAAKIKGRNYSWAQAYYYENDKKLKTPVDE